MDKHKQANNLIKIVQGHKSKCKDSECEISLLSLGILYRQLVDRKLSEEERKSFL